MQFISGNFNGTAATLYICIGFVPDWVHLWNLEATTPIEDVWNKQMMRSGEFVEGMQFQWHGTFTSSDATPLTKGNGIMPYFGGDTLTSTTAGTTTYGEGVYLKPFNYDVRFNSTDSPHSYYDGAESTIDTWTLDNSTNYTGNFGSSGAATGTYIGEGSPIKIDGIDYAIVAFTADGGDSNDVTLSYPAPSGTIQFIGGMYSTIPMISGEITAPGFRINDTTLNADGNICIFEAGKYDV